jgi:cytochrome c biogenesis protein CcdA
MPSHSRNKQKSLQRRFLFIFGVFAFICYLAAGLTVIFWDKILPDYGTRKILFGILLIVYGVYRFIRLFRKEDIDE